jgi:hypothetical protein
MKGTAAHVPNQPSLVFCIFFLQKITNNTLGLLTFCFGLFKMLHVSYKDLRGDAVLTTSTGPQASKFFIFYLKFRTI